MTEAENIRKFLTNDIVKDVVSIRKIEQLAGLPARSLYDFVKGRKHYNFNVDRVEKVLPILLKIGYKPLNSDVIFL